MAGKVCDLIHPSSPKGWDSGDTQILGQLRFLQAGLKSLCPGGLSKGSPGTLWPHRAIQLLGSRFGRGMG